MRRYQHSYLLPQEIHRQKPVCIIPSQFDACGVQGAPKVTMESQRLQLFLQHKNPFFKIFFLGCCCNQLPNLFSTTRIRAAWEGDPAAPMGAQSGWDPPCQTSCCSPFNSFSREAPQPIPAEGDELHAQCSLLQPECLGVPASLPSTCSRYVLPPLPKAFLLVFPTRSHEIGHFEARLGDSIWFVSSQGWV